jgi:hypothetical protein
MPVVISAISFHFLVDTALIGESSESEITRAPIALTTSD